MSEQNYEKYLTIPKIFYILCAFLCELFDFMKKSYIFAHLPVLKLMVFSVDRLPSFPINCLPSMTRP